MDGPMAREIAMLLREIRNQHADDEDPRYNECDTGPCDWCERAGAVIQRLEKFTALWEEE